MTTRNQIQTFLTLAAATLLALAALSVTPARAALISHWAFDDGSPSQLATDSHGANDLTLGGTLAVQASDPTWTAASRIGPHALSFDGGDWAEIADNPSLATPLITVSAWVKRSAGFGSRGREMIAGKGNGGGGGNQTFWLDFEADERLGFYLHIGGDRYLRTPSGTTVADTDWHHLVGTYDGSTQRIYLDGAQVASSSISGTVTVNAHPLFVGKGYVGGGEPVTGTVDDVGLWNNALDPVGVTALFSLASEADLNYDANEVNQMLEAFANSDPAVVIDGRLWTLVDDGSLSGIGEGEVQSSFLGFAINLGNGNGFISFIPEPSSFALLGLGLCGLLRRRRS